MAHLDYWCSTCCSQMACSACLKALHPGGKWHGDAFPLNLLRYGALHTYILQVIAARFSDGLGMQYRSRYEAWCGQLAALEFMLLQYFQQLHWLLLCGHGLYFQWQVFDFYFISRRQSSYCGDGWLVLLELGFKDHSPSDVAMVGTF